MPYKPTGKPPGRPKTNWYETLSARVPQNLAEQVRRYASRHRQTLSDVFRDGFTLLLQDDRYAPFTADTHAMPDIASDTNGAQEIVSNTITTALGIVSDTKKTSESLAEALHRQRLREIVSDTNETSESVPEIASDTNDAHPVLLDAVALDAMPGASVAIPRQSAAAADKASVLAQLHDWKAAGVSLQTMADRLNTSEVSTFSGKGNWKKGTIGNLLAPRPAPVA